MKRVVISLPETAFTLMLHEKNKNFVVQEMNGADLNEAFAPGEALFFRGCWEPLSNLVRIFLRECKLWTMTSRIIRDGLRDNKIWSLIS